MAIYQANAEITQLIKIDNLLENPEVRVDFSNLSDDDQIRFFHILTESIFFIFQQ